MQNDRQVLVAPGPRFFLDGADLMFEHVIDGSNRIGPRLARPRDKDDHPEAWGLYQAEQPSRDDVADTVPRARGRPRKEAA